MKVCRTYELDCYRDMGATFTNNLMVKRCECLPECTSISYDFETSYVPVRDLDSKYDRQSEYIATSAGRILYKEENFIAIIRSETNTMSDFISSCGGLLGLFMGVSLLSIIELFYFFTLRLCCRFRDEKRVQCDA